MTQKSRPEVSLCLASTLDGKISEAPGRAPNFTSRFDRHKLFRLRAEADVLLVGANTVRQELLPPLVRDPQLIAQRKQAGKPDHPAVAIVSRSLQLPWQEPYFQKPQQRLFVISQGLSHGPPVEAKGLPIEWLATEEPHSLPQAMNLLAKHGFQRVLAEGGGSLVHGLLAARLVDRFFLTIAPTVLAGDEGPSLCRGSALLPRPEFELVDCLRHQNELHLEYRVRVDHDHPTTPIG